MKKTCLYMRRFARTRTDRMTGPLLLSSTFVKLLVLGLELPYGEISVYQTMLVI